MKLLLYTPLTFICGEHGFAIFVPYLVMFLASAYVIRQRVLLARAKRIPVHVDVATRVTHHAASASIPTFDK